MRRGERRLLQHPYLLGIVQDDMQRDAARSSSSSDGSKKPSSSRIGPRISGCPQRERRVELDQCESVGIVERRQHALQSMAVRIRLDDGQHFRRRCVPANATRDSLRSQRDRPLRRSGGPCGLDERTAACALSATTGDAAGRPRPHWEGLWDHGIKRRPRDVRIITIHSEHPAARLRPPRPISWAP